MKLAIVGMGRSGKDTAAEFLSARTGLRYAGSMSWAALPYMAARLGVCEQTAWERRHEQRLLWRAWLDEFRAEDPLRLVRLCLAKADIVTGLRSCREFTLAWKQELFDEVMWIERAVPRDETLEFGPEDCTVVIGNGGTLEEFYGRLQRWAEAMGKFIIE